MTNMETQRKSALPIIAGVLFSIKALYGVYVQISEIETLLPFFKTQYLNMILSYSGTIFLILLAVSLFIRKPLFTGISLSGLAIIGLYFMTVNMFYIDYGDNYIDILVEFLWFSAYVLLALIVLLVNAGKTSIKCVWFLPSILAFLDSLYSCFTIIISIRNMLSRMSIYSDFSQFAPYLVERIINILLNIAGVVGILLIGRWIYQKGSHTRKPVRAPYRQPAYQNVPVAPMQYTQQTPYTPMPQPNWYYQNVQQPIVNTQPKGYSAAAIERELTTLKNLADNGIITNEEYEIKKKQILGI